MADEELNGTGESSEPSEETSSLRDDFHALFSGDPIEDDTSLDMEGVANALSGKTPEKETEDETADASSNGEAEDSSKESDTGAVADEETSEEDPAANLELETDDGPVVEDAAPTAQEQQIAALMEQVASLTSTLTKQQQTAAEAASTANAAAEEQAANAATQYNFDIPEPLMAALESEDVADRKKGMVHLLNSLATTVHTRMRAEVQAVQQQIPTFVSQSLEQTNQQAAIRNDFFEKFPDLKNPALSEVVRGAIGEVMQAESATEWSASIRDKVGNRVTELLKGAAPRTTGRTKPATSAPKTATVGKGAGGASVTKPATSKTVGSQVQDLISF